MNWLNMIIGLFLLFFGRGIFWLFVACIGFASGYHYAQQIGGIHSPLTVLIIALVAGGLGAIIAIFFQKAAVLMVGFAAGGYVGLSLTEQFVGLPAPAVWLTYITGGILGAVILYVVFDGALILLSTLTGATLIVRMAAFDPGIKIVLFSLLVIAGAAVQAKVMIGERRTQ